MAFYSRMTITARPSGKQIKLSASLNSSNCHERLTISNMTRDRPVVGFYMGITIIKRTNPKNTGVRRTERRLVLQFSRKFFARENRTQFAIEAFLFATLLAISALPVIAAAVAISSLL